MKAILKRAGYSIIVLLFNSYISIAQFPRQIDSLIAALKSSKHDTNKVRLLNSLSYKLIDFDTTKSLYYGTEARNLSVKLNFKRGLANAYNNIELLYYNLGRYKKALENAHYSLSVFVEINDSVGISMLLGNIGNIYMDNGNYDTAIAYQLSSLGIDRRAGNKKGMSGTYSNLGLIYESKADYDNALKYYLEDLKMEEELGNNRGLANAYNNVGNLNFVLGEYDKAIENHLKAKAIRETFYDQQELAYTLTNLGNAYLNKGGIDTALLYYNAALPKLEKIGDRKGIIGLLSNMGAAYYLTKKYSEALRLFLKSKKLAEEGGNKFGVSTALINIAQIHVDLRHYADAIPSYKEAIDIAKQIGAQDRIRDGYKGLSDNYIEMGDYKNGYITYKHYTEFKDSVSNEAKIKNINDLKIRYETQKKEQAIILYEKNKIIDAANLSRQKSQKLFIIVISLFFILLSVIIIQYWRRRSKLSEFKTLALENETKIFAQEKRIKTLEILNQHATNHEIKTLVKNISVYVKIKMNRFIRRDSPTNDPFRLNVEHVVHFSEVVSNYITKYYLYSKEIVTTVYNEIELSKEYAQAFQIIHLGEGYTINVINNISDNYVLKEMHVPTHLLNNFIMNSMKHGLKSDGREIQYVLDIAISSKKTEKGYLLEIDDNGCGINHTRDMDGTAKKDSSGNTLAKDLIQVFNNFNEEKYSIVFSDDMVYDKQDIIPSGKGTRVILEFIEKSYGK